MKTRVPDYFKKFECISSECEDTCCAGWEIVIDDDTYEYYSGVKGQFGERLKSEIILDEGENIFTLKGNDCAFLNKNKMCDIYSELGKDALCTTCKQYPRFIEEYGSIREIGLSLSCPEAARIILNSSDIVEFELEEDDEMVSAYNDISYELFMQLMPARKLAIKILQNREIELHNRMALVLSFAQEIQDKIDQNKIAEILDVRTKYAQNEFLEESIKKFEKYKNNSNFKYENLYKIFEVYQELDHINENWPKVLSHTMDYYNENKNSIEYNLEKAREFNEYYNEKNYEFEHLMVYFIFRYFMKSVYDYDVAAKVKLAVVSYLIIKELDITRFIDNEGKFSKADQVDIMHMYSKDIEHSEENIEALYEIFETNKIFSLNDLITILMN